MRQQSSLRKSIFRPAAEGVGRPRGEGCKAIFKLDHQMPLVGNGDVREKRVSREHSLSQCS